MSMTGFLGRTNSSQSCRQTKKNPRSWVADFWRGSPLSHSMSMPYLYLSCQTKTDHMLVAHFDPVNGWSAPEIKPYGPLHIDPASSCLQYCSNVFEGLKVRLDALVDGIYLHYATGRLTLVRMAIYDSSDRKRTCSGWSSPLPGYPYLCVTTW